MLPVVRIVARYEVVDALQRTKVPTQADEREGAMRSVRSRAQAMRRTGIERVQRAVVQSVLGPLDRACRHVWSEQPLGEELTAGVQTLPVRSTSQRRTVAAEG